MSADSPALPADDAEVIDVEGEEVHTTELVVADARDSALMRPVASEHDIVAAFLAYQGLREAILEPSDFQEAERGKHFVTKSGWRKLATAMGVSDQLTAKDYDRDERGRVIRAEVTVRAVAPNGRYTEGIGICDYRERCKRSCKDDCDGFTHFSKPQHDIPSTAHTRAKNRALSDLFGFGEVSADEVTGGIGERHTPDEPADGAEVAEIVAAMNGIADPGQRRGTKLAFVSKFGQPHSLMKSKIEEARRMVTASGGKFTGPEAAADASPTDASNNAAPSREESSGSGEADGHVGAPHADEGNSSGPSPEPSDTDGPPVTHQGPGAADVAGQPPTPRPSARSTGSAATTPKPSEAKQRSRIAIRVKELVEKGLLREGDKPELVAILTGERTNTTTEMGYDEANHMISLLAFLESNDLSVEDSEDGGRQVACLTERGKDFLAPIVAAIA